MARQLTIKRERSLIGGHLKWAIVLNGVSVAAITGGQTQTITISEQAQQLEIIQLSMLGKPTINCDRGTALIMAGAADCTVTASVQTGIFKDVIRLKCAYDRTEIPEEAFVEAVTRLIVGMFQGEAALRWVNDPNNRRRDLRVACRRDGVHICWEMKNPGRNIMGMEDNLVPYETAGVSLAQERLEDNLLRRLECSIREGVLSNTRFVVNEYGCFAPGEDASRAV